MNRRQVGAGEEVEAAVDVENTGSQAGDEVVQLYIHQRSGSASRPVRQLKGFRRITLAPGGKTTVNFALGKDELSYWSPSGHAWVEKPSEFDVWVGETRLHRCTILLPFIRNSLSDAGGPGIEARSSRLNIENKLPQLAFPLSS